MNKEMADNQTISERVLSRRTLLGGIAAGGAAVAMGAVGGPASASTRAELTRRASSKNLPVVRASVAPFGSQLFPALITQQMGLDKKYGFTLKIINFSNAPQEYLQLTGDAADISAGTWLDLEQNQARGFEVLAIGPLLRYTNVMLVPKNSSITSPADLKGKNIGVYFEEGADTEAVRAAIEVKYGFDFFKASSVQQVDAALLGPEMLRGQFDAIYTFSNLAATMVASGQAKQLFTAAQILQSVFQLTIDDPFGIWVSSVFFVNQHPNRAAGYLAAYREAVHIMRTTPSVWPGLAKTQNVSGAKNIAALMNETNSGFATTWNAKTITHMQTIFNLMYKIGGSDLTGISKFNTKLYPLKYWNMD